MEEDLKTNAYNKAILKWGVKAQMEMAQEEATELALAIRKEIRNNNDASFNNLVEEIADVELMIEQILLINHDIGMRELIESVKDSKIKRLIKRLE